MPANYGFTTWSIGAPTAKGNINLSTSKTDRYPVTNQHLNRGTDDQWTFNGTAGERIFVSHCIVCSIAWDTRAGRAVLYAYPQPYQSNQDALLHTEAGSLVLPQAGTYTFLVTARTSIYLDPHVAVDSYDYNFEIWAPPADASPVAISLNKKYEGEIASAGTVDMYTFTGIAGQKVYFRSETPTNYSYPYPDPIWWEVRVPTAASCVCRRGWTGFTTHDYASGNIGRITLPRTGTYTILVHAYATDTNFTPDAELGQYAFSVLTVPKPTHIDLGATDAFDIEPGSLNGVSYPGVGTIESSGATDEFVFTADAGDQWKFDRGTAPNGIMEDRLVGPDGLTVFPDYFIAYPPGIVTLPLEGEYHLIVYGPGAMPAITASTSRKVGSGGGARRVPEPHEIAVGSGVKPGVITDPNGVDTPDHGAGVLEGAGAVGLVLHRCCVR